MMMREDKISQTPESEPWCLSVAGLPAQRRKEGNSETKDLNWALINGVSDPNSTPCFLDSHQ